jgi:hypothetical protein
MLETSPAGELPVASRFADMSTMPVATALSSSRQTSDSRDAPLSVNCPVRPALPSTLWIETPPTALPPAT